MLLDIVFKMDKTVYLISFYLRSLNTTTTPRCKPHRGQLQIFYILMLFNRNSDDPRQRGQSRS